MEYSTIVGIIRWMWNLEGGWVGGGEDWLSSIIHPQPRKCIAVNFLETENIVI
jgi:hypothetical protein